MNRRAFVTGLGAVLAAPRAADAQQERAGKVWRIATVLAGTNQTLGHIAKAIATSLANLGYVAGQNITLQHRFFPPDPAGAEEVLRAIIGDVDLLVVGG